MKYLSLLLLLGCDSDTKDSLQETDTSEVGDSGELDTEPEPEPEPEPEDLGADDAYAQAACGLRGGAPEELVLAASASEAAQQTIVADSVPRQLLMPESGDGWMVIEIPDWMAYVRVFSDDGVEYEVMGDDVEAYTECQTNGACPDEGITDQLIGFHAWGAYSVRFSEGPESLWFVAIEED